MTVHDKIDNYLAADLHDELSNEERTALHTHLIECADCRKLHQETKLMNKVLEENLANEKPDLAFEQRMLTGFRNRIPQKNGGLVKLLVDLMRLRATQITALAAVLLALFQIGRTLTGEARPYPYGGAQTATTLPIPTRGSFEDLRMKLAGYDTDRIRKEHEQAEIGHSIVTGSNIPTANEVGANPVDTFRLQDIEKPGVRQSPALTANGASRDDSRFDEKDKIAQAPAAPVPGAAGLPSSTTSQFKSDISSLPTKSADMAKTKEAPGMPAPPNDSPKLIRNSKVELEIVSFDEAVQKITSFASEEKGYIATSGSQKQANGKLRGEVVVKVLPENLDRFLQKIRELGELKNQTLGTEDVTKAYLDTDSRLKNARVMEQRLIDMLKTKTGKVADLLQVEKELGRVREDIEKMQGELKYWDSQVQFATVTIALAEKDMEEPAAFLLKERAQLALYTPDVEKIYNEIKTLASAKTQISSAQLDRDNTGRVSAHVSVLIAPEESDAQITRVKAMGRVQNFQVQTARIAQGGNPATAGSENARIKRDKVELNINISREEQEQSVQQTRLCIRTSAVDEKTKELRAAAEKENGRVCSSSFSRDPDGREFANVSLRVPMKNYPALIQSLNQLGKLENVTVQRQDRTGQAIDEANAPADISIQVYSQGNIVSYDTGLFATLRRTLAQGVGALMWSVRMIGVAIAFLAPWGIALALVIWVASRIFRARRQKRIG